MQGRNKFRQIGNFMDFSERGKDTDIYNPLMKGYILGVKDELIKQLVNDKKMTIEDADVFKEDIFIFGDRQNGEIRKDIKNCYTKDKSKKECATILIDKYYKLTKFDNYQDPNTDDEIREVNEGKDYFHYKNVSTSLFWNYVRILNRLDIKFKFNTSFINNNPNSLNTKYYLFYIETDPTLKEDILYEFSNSKILSKTVDIISKSEEEQIVLFIGINKENKLRFGYKLGKIKYTIGNINYKSNDIKKLSPSVEYISDDISFINLSEKFKTNLVIINELKDLISLYLMNYTDTKIYINVLNNKISLIIEAGNDIVNDNYLRNIIKDNKINKYHVEFEINKSVNNNKNYYRINLK